MKKVQTKSKSIGEFLVFLKWFVYLLVVVLTFIGVVTVFNTVTSFKVVVLKVSDTVLVSPLQK